MKKLTSAQVRQMFLDFFKSKGHHIEPSASLIPVDDPTLLWINSGVATLKKYFDGSIVPENPRITNAQKSIRTNDIENVGRTARHHTMFEMLGNFSIGDYFKKEAITWAWEFLTSPNWIGFEPQKLYVTVYPKDREARQIWEEVVGLPKEHVIDVEDNFWDIGAGPSGPDSEIFYDRGKEYLDIDEKDPENYPGGENERYLEVWNLVFSQFNHLAGTDIFEDLPNKNIDTGMGLERMVSILQDAPTNFETDLFLPIIWEVEKISGQTYDPQNNEKNMSFKVIADHIRALSFAITDGAAPSNEGRGYVLRRLLRRAVMHGKKLKIKGAFLYKLVPIVGEIMESYYPEVKNATEFTQKIIKNEEDTFARTIDAGANLLQDLLAKLKLEQKSVLAGKDIFKLYDTYGFPVELTEELAAEASFEIDQAGFKTEMKKQQARARANVVKGGSMDVQSEVLTDLKTKSEFSYNEIALDSILEVIVANDKLTKQINSGIAELIFKKTPFYAESGGQVADHGVIKDQADQVVAKVIDVQKAPNGQPLHKVEVLGELIVGEKFRLEINFKRRYRIMKNHTSAHLLHAALHNILGEHAEQAGSLNEEEFLRFDFNHFAATTSEELAAIERQVNEEIWRATPLEVIETDLSTAKKMGAQALFGEKYGQNVRVIKIGDYSLELCGGTHVRNTAEIGLFKILKEEGIGSGVRRITAVTSEFAYQEYYNQETMLKNVANLVKAPQLKEAVTKVSTLNENYHALQKENEALATKLANQQASVIFKDVKTIGKTTYIAAKVNVNDMNHLRFLADQWKQQQLSDCLILVAENAGKVLLLVATTPSANERGIKAGVLIKKLAPLVGGGGGGRDDLAQAGGKNPQGISTMLAKVSDFLSDNED